MKNNEDLPRVHAPNYLPSTNIRTATNELLEGTNPRNVTEDKAVLYDVGEPAVLKTGNEDNSVSGDKVIIALKSRNEDNSVSKDKAASDIFDSDAESLPNLDSEDETEEWFEENTTRIAFIQKVLAIKLLQLLGITGVTVLVFVNRWSLGINDFLNNANMTHLVVLCIFAFIVTNVVSFGFLFGRNVEEARRKNPFRYMFLTIYPLRISALIVICTLYWYLTTSVLIIMIYYCVVVFILFMYSILSCQTNLDFTFKYSAIVAVSTQVILCTVTAPSHFPFTYSGTSR
ncbi:uncharacterized protein LOC125231677 [Leguminivora glycinivorella]|uniref:uncharacterized protein LOC125231677 n=1 Tax=Leguminivora glycinivorella TaxID=1035111 RepID=UPI00200FBE43|nr:uncharacterized protein LOC125231677 [Leguminivora glycinivorella]